MRGPREAARAIDVSPCRFSLVAAAACRLVHLFPRYVYICIYIYVCIRYIYIYIEYTYICMQESIQFSFSLRFTSSPVGIIQVTPAPSIPFDACLLKHRAKRLGYPCASWVTVP